MSVELKVELVGDDPQQRQAFDNPAFQGGGQQPEPWITPGMTAGGVPLNLSIDQLAKVIDTLAKAIGEFGAQEGRDKTSSDIADDGQLTRAARRGSRSAFLNALNGVLPGSEDQEQEPGSQPGSGGGGFGGLLKGINDTIQQKLTDFGLAGTRVGRMIGGASSGIANAAGALGNVGQSFGLGGAAGAGAAAGGSGGAAAAGAGLAAVSGPAVAVAAALAGAALSVKLFSDSINRLADELEDMSPAIAGVRAQFDATRQLQRLDRARELGPQVAQLEAARFRISESMYDVQTKIYGLMLKAAPAVEFILDAVNVGVRQFELGVAVANQIAAAVMTPFDDTDDKKAAVEAAEAAKKANEAMAELLRNGDMGAFGQIDPYLGELLGIGQNGGGQGQPQRPQPPQPPFP